MDFANTLEGSVAIIGLEAGPLSQWLHRGLADARLEVVLMETRQVKGALKAMPIKTDLRRALCQAATVMIHRGRSTWLRSWAAQVAKRRGAKRAMVALARRIGTILHRMWTDGTEFSSDQLLAKSA
ncbi:hypothetical protein [Brucella intermedia]|uniref:hypothetical protein n=1 Tax=Brucella intermedia TaxID=94625 RepID=UPI0022487647